MMIQILSMAYSKKNSSGPDFKSIRFWIRIVVLGLLLWGVIALIIYLQTGELEKNANVQGFLNPENSGITGRVIIDKKPPKPKE